MPVVEAVTRSRKRQHRAATPPVELAEALSVPGAGNTWRVCAYLYSGGDDTVAPDVVGTTLLSIPPTRAELLARAIKMCHKTKNRARRAKCLALARKHYGPKR